MRRIRRLAVQESTQRMLDARSRRVAEAQDPEAEVNATWRNKTSAAWDDVRATLRAMSTGRGRCMYCEDSAGSAIEHFYPKSSFPRRAYDWQNYLWACSVCNSNEKRYRFPLVKGRPTLIDPTSDDPANYLEFSPRTGKWIPKLGCVEGRDSIDVFGLSRTDLDELRKEAWMRFEHAILIYGKKCASDDARARALVCAMRTAPFSGVLAALLRFAKDPRRRKYVAADVLEILDLHPEIQDIFE